MSMNEIIKDIESNITGNERTFQVGDRVIWKPIGQRDGFHDKLFEWYGAKATVIMIITLNRAYIALDDFPNCNDREKHNRFCANFEELELIE